LLSLHLIMWGSLPIRVLLIIILVSTIVQARLVLAELHVLSGWY
jgi:hypothetical protein